MKTGYPCLRVGGQARRSGHAQGTRIVSIVTLLRNVVVASSTPGFIQIPPTNPGIDQGVELSVQLTGPLVTGKARTATLNNETDHWEESTCLSAIFWTAVPAGGCIQSGLPVIPE